MSVNGKIVFPRRNGSFNLGPSPRNIFFEFSLSNDRDRPPSRVRYRLEGEDAGWRDGPGEMHLAVRFYNSAGDQVSQSTFKVMGESAGWTGSVSSSPLTHRREVVVVPETATRLWIVLSSAGPPATVGIYVVANLTVSKFSGNSPPVVVMESPLNQDSEEDVARNPPGWTRDGNHSSMARVVTLRDNPVQKALAILDEDGGSHAEWHNIMESAPTVIPGEQVVVEWNEMFSMGMVDFNGANYDGLKEGSYRFHLAEFDLFGRPRGNERVREVLVPRPFWRTSWFWSVIGMGAVTITFGFARYVVWRRMRLEMLRLKNQQALEKERLRIAQDIHDDLGARVTEISLISALAKTKPAFPESASADFDQISGLSRELVSALYETVWAVDPENDNLDALGNYLCQITNKLCGQAQLPCRFQLSELPATVEVSSQTRHNIIMAVKEAVHNIIKHAKASEVTLSAAYDGRELIVLVKDNGGGFAAESSPAGNGMTNMKRRLASIGGVCSIESVMGKGTEVEIRFGIPSAPG